jgi:microcystin degradation protein MlrC
MARPACAARRIPFLIPLSAQCTDLAPSQGLYAALAAMESRDVPTLSFTPGFPAADFPECGPVVFAYGLTAGHANAAADALARRVEDEEARFDLQILDAEAAVRRAMQLAARANRPIVIADTQDNPGAGGDSDTTGMLRALLACGAQRAALGLMVDPAAANAALAAGVGRSITLGLGGRSGIPGDAPLQGSYRVEAVSEGRVVCNGPFSRGATMDLGPSACLSIGGVRVVVCSRKTQLADQALYRFVGIEPTAQAILVNKSSVHFRADFTPIAHSIIVAAAPGPMIADPADLPWTRLAPGLRLKPLGRAFQPR